MPSSGRNAAVIAASRAGEGTGPYIYAANVSENLQGRALLLIPYSDNIERNQKSQAEHQAQRKTDIQMEGEHHPHQKREHDRHDEEPKPQDPEHVGPVAVVEMDAGQVHAEGTLAVGVDLVFVIIGGQGLVGKQAGPAAEDQTQSF